MSSGAEQARQPAPGRKIRFFTTFRNSIYVTLQERGWEEVKSSTDDWDFIWATVEWIMETFETRRLPTGCRVNHFRSFAQLCRKDLMARHIKDARKLILRARLPALAAEFDCTPRNFNLPTEFPIVGEYARAQGEACVFIVKPSSRAQGRGIFLTRYRGLCEWFAGTFEKPAVPGVPPDELERPSFVVQQYIANPLLVCGHKFDMRIYVLVESFSPLVCWVCREGFGRFSLQPFNNDFRDLDNPEMHLTNVAIQKHSALYNNEGDGAKWSVFNIGQYLDSCSGRKATDVALLAIERLILRSLQAVANDMSKNPESFEIYGYDIMLDDTLRPWLIEVNASPSLSADTVEDSIVKRRMLHDAISIVGVDCAPAPPSCAHYGCWDKLFSGPVPKLTAAILSPDGFQDQLDRGMIHPTRPLLGTRHDRAYQLFEQWACASPSP